MKQFYTHNHSTISKMKKIKKILLYALAAVLAIGAVLYFTLSPVLAQKLKTFNSESNITWTVPPYDKAKKTVLVIAENDGTELFDLMAPYYLFNATENANVYVVAEKKAPILLVNSLFILPHYSYSEIDSLHIVPDVIVIPNLSVRLKVPPRTANVNFIKEHVTDSTIVLSVCDGSATAAATGLYDGKPLTTHATDLSTLQKQFPEPLWIKNTSVTESGNFYSTAGVSNAVEGSLVVIKRLFGEETVKNILDDIRYPHSTIRVDHKSDIVNTGAIIRIATKVIFNNDKRVGVLIDDRVNEFQLASVLDTYVRSFPSSINTISLNGGKVISKYGLVLYPTGNIEDKLDELHVLNRLSDNSLSQNMFVKATIVNYEDELKNKYPIDICLDRISSQYGDRFKNCVKLTLDYN
jgi:putative intracellular protease/amidase